MKKLIGLDLLRIIFALIIAFFHLSIHFSIHLNGNIVIEMVDRVISVGAIFMVGFFMLSGFVLQYHYRETDFSDKNNLKKFYRKRFFCIYPAYFVFLMIIFSFRLSFPDTLPKVFAILGCEFFCLQTFFPTTFNICGNGGTWFISVMVFLYFLFPLISIILKKIVVHKKYCFIVGFAICYFLSVYHGLMQFLFGGSMASYYTNFLIRLPEFVIGMLLAEWFLKRKEKERWCNCFTVSIATIFFIVAVNQYFEILKGNYTQYNFIVVPYIGILILFMTQFNFKSRTTWGGVNWFSGHLLYNIVFI